MNPWRQIPDGEFQRPGSTHPGSKVCMSDGERAAHSHYFWAKDRFWAVFGDFRTVAQ